LELIVYETFIGLEIHIHLATETKMFCGCKASYGDAENTNICPVCMGYPGVLPAVNEKALELGYLVARALNCKLSRNTIFERKNYFYPDMPKNYQISQFREPVGRDGWMEIDWEGQKKRIRIHDVHLEEDAGKMIHAGDMTLLDYNRAGYPLLEIVTEPDLKSGEETEAFLRCFQRLVRYLAVSDGNMDEGSMKCDANVSINLAGKGLGTKVEVKNMNSPRFIRLAMAYEVERQKICLEQNKPIYQETRLWNENRDSTEPMRRKEGSEDYRYFPEPDLPPFRPDDAFLKQVEAGLVELPQNRKDRLKAQYGLNDEQAEYIHDDRYTADFFEEAVKLGTDAGQIFAWLSSDVKKLLNRDNKTLEQSPLTAKRLASLISLIASDKISGKIGKKVLEHVFEEDKDPEVIIKEKGMVQITDKGAIEAVIAKICTENSALVEEIRNGDERKMGFLVGQVMKATGGQAAPMLVQELLQARIKG
jgi:aspartyl-tRNA(Asn)/glutamyl-tRNA(Gln) amidotransferase subunit B